MTSIKVALVGATGNLGPAVLKELLAAGFDVTVLTRQGNSNTFDSRAHVAEVDYESLDSLKAALSGQDVVVSTLNVGAVPKSIHLRLVDAAVATGVKRFIPSEYGCDTTNPLASTLPVFGDKISVQEHLKNVTQQSGLSYSLLITGPFLDWGLEKGFVLNLAGPATLYDGGDRPFSSTTLAGIGKGVVGIINNLEATKNSTIYINEARVTQNELLELSGKSLETNIVQTTDLEQEAFTELAKPAPNPAVFAPKFILRGIFGEGHGGLFDSEKLSNDLFGLKTLSKEEIRGLIPH
ncbi:uncharacterized protein N7479_006837 [Penicillium vulpinum]|uniref:NmrA-like domain-containing protein n=1 Tax=Penicillium vulpinum TaxID=29845 RepID=A0A1V6RVZ3_9EURO|nr:uncharacterized protein N7479_006837 [Penicillium vulpinum]KAJ5959687.1 hypothetical protein N7479_006837 [Penicillium vulpinum]OQE05690.1 hypothetical protein PENVUL_c022G07888 [Penicillium vulpinum]